MATSAGDVTQSRSGTQSRATVLAPSEFLFLAFDGSQPLSGGARYALTGIDEVALGRVAANEAERVVARDENERRMTLRFPGRVISGRHARLERHGTGWRVEDLESTHGTFVNGHRIERATKLQDGDTVEVGTAFLRYRVLMAPEAEVPILDTRELRGTQEGLVTLIPAFALDLYRLQLAVRVGTASFLVTGETGTGKEVLSRAIHALSRRRGQFVAVNCSAIPETLVESELFGHKKGAFTGAGADRKGLFELAHEGTLLLDEIAELKPAAQAALLRVLQEREVRPVGASRTIPVDVLVIAATNADVLDAKAFRQDLYARLSAFELRMPPLRDRREDIGFLLAELMRRHHPEAIAAKITFSRAAIRQLLAYPWPRNVRELEGVLQNMVATASADTGHVQPSPILDARARPGTVPGTSQDDATRREITDTLRRHKSLRAAARELGKDASYLRRLLKKLNIRPEDFLGTEE
jgi:DNA-binding NtrC family response regulator